VCENVCVCVCVCVCVLPGHCAMLKSLRTIKNPLQLMYGPRSKKEDIVREQPPRVTAVPVSSCPGRELPLTYTLKIRSSAENVSVTDIISSAIIGRDRETFR
jgi:hypothetical protein